MGLTTGGITGRLMAELITRDKPRIDLAPFRIDREY
jgi:glycine/D-amino acid oxidase-like deaminating enzyme